jgi:hypothetical protein
MSLGGEYTPQMVVGGESQFVGSDRRGIARAIAAESSASAPGRVSLHTNLGVSSPQKLQIKVNAKIEQPSDTGPLVVMVAVYENGLVSKIGGGENSGREITYDYTVRKLLRALELNSSSGASAEKELSIDLDRSWSLDHVGVAAFIQDPRSLRIQGAASEYPIARNLTPGVLFVSRIESIRRTGPA